MKKTSRELSRLWARPGDVLFEFMSPMTVVLGFRMFASRGAIYSNKLAILGGTIWASVTSLFGTVYVARMCGISPELSLMLGNRSVTSPFGLAGAAALGANAALTLTYIIVSGIC
jgi:putative effector of murein hydrolase